MTQSSFPAISARIQAQMQTIPNIGVVHNRRRVATDMEEIRDNLVATIGGEDRIRAWWIFEGTLNATPEDAAGNMRWDRIVTIEGFLQWEDANSSELTTSTLAESIIRTLAADIRATKLGGTILSGKPPSLKANEPRLMTLVLSHYCRLEMPLLSIDI